jgi:hypothetical protein
MRENPLGGKAGHADQEIQTRANRDDIGTQETYALDVKWP